MRIYLDTSALAKRYVQEPGSEELEELFFTIAEEVHVSTLALPEYTSAISRKIRDKTISEDSAARAIHEMEKDWQGLFLKIPVTDELSQQAAALTIQHPLKGADAVHLATALAGRYDLFVTSDDKMIKAAEQAGISAYNPASGVFRR